MTNEQRVYDQKQIPEIVRRECYDRDNWKCRRCGNDNVEDLSLHHVIKRSQGGDHHPANLVTVCWIPCHMMLEDHVIDVKRINEHWYFSG
jgi:5-methylcytosine-specific restriction endonuclease McrA